MLLKSQLLIRLRVATAKADIRLISSSLPALLERKYSTNMDSRIIAISQMKATNDKAHNMQQVQQLVAKAKQQNAQVLFLPECCDFVGESREQTLQLSESLDGPLMQQYQALAKQNGMWLSLGGIHEAIMKEGTGKVEKLYNAHVLLNDQGELVSIYRKLHLFDVDTPEFRFRESAIVAPGPKLVPPVPTPWGAIGLQICYDMRFAEASLLLRKAGAQLLTYPSAFAYSTGKAHWELLLRARAIENQCFVVAAAQVGFHNAKRQSWGHAMIVDPWGKILANLGPDCELDVATAQVDLSTLESVRRNMPCFEHRRDDVYSLAALKPPHSPISMDRQFGNNIIDKNTIFYETPTCFAFTNLRCVVRGHVLVSTKRQIARLNGLNCDEMSDLFVAVNRIQRMLEFVYKTTAATVTVQDGTDAGQTVPHVHFHVMPRRPGDFGHNDQVYVKLDDRCENTPNRSNDERVEEAQIYKKIMEEQHF